MRPSYRPRNNLGNRRGGAGGGQPSRASTAGSRVNAPKPVQTSSLKAESGVFDLTTILVPAAAKEKGGTWGRTQPNVPKQDDPVVQTATSTLLPDKKLKRDTESPTTSERSSTPGSDQETGHLGSPAWGSTVNVEPDADRHPTLQSVQAPSSQMLLQNIPPQQTAHSQAPNSRPLSDELFPPLAGHPIHPVEEGPSVDAPSCVKQAVDTHYPEDTREPVASLKPVIFSDKPAPRVFQTPAPEEADTEEEKERRRRSLALEQQRLILEQVEAARAAAKASKKETIAADSRKPVSVLMRRKNNHEPKRDGNGRITEEPASQPPVQPKVTRKGPRTKGRLYSRLADGSLVEERSQTGETCRPDGNSEDGGGAGATEEEIADAIDKKDVPTGDPKAAPAHSKSKTKKKSWQSNHRRPRKQKIAAVDS